ESATIASFFVIQTAAKSSNAFSLRAAISFTSYSNNSCTRGCSVAAKNNRSRRGPVARTDFPGHKVVQRLPCLSDRKRQHHRVIGKPEAGNPIGDKIEWIEDVNDGADDHHQILQRHVAVFAAVVGANQTQHRLEVGPKFLERLSRYRRSFFYRFLKELT